MVLTESIVRDGIKEPLEVRIEDQLGRICLRNGYHRLVIAIDSDISQLPVVIERSDKLGNSHAVPVGDILERLILSLPKPNEHLERAVQFALLVNDDDGTSGWSWADALTALEVASGREVHPARLQRMVNIDPHVVPSTPTERNRWDNSKLSTET